MKKSIAIVILAIICGLLVVPFIKCKDDPVISDPVQNAIDSLEKNNDSLLTEIIIINDSLSQINEEYIKNRDSILN